jgi:predicted permease
MFKTRSLTVSAMILIAAVSRLIPHPWNLTPVAAIALFGGAQFLDRRSAFVVPFAALLLTDLVLGFYPMMFLTYVCFGATVLIGRTLRQNRTVSKIIFASVAASWLFFLVTNFGCWLTMAEYSKDLTGLAACYSMAIPFFRNTLIGDMFFSGVLFGSFALSEKFFPALRARYS